MVVPNLQQTVGVLLRKFVTTYNFYLSNNYTNRMRPILFYVFFIFPLIFLNVPLFAQIIDLTKPVGSTDGSAAVTATGGATYNIPIDVLKGTNGMEPKVNLTYNSQGGEGIAGFGWNISAYSMIARQGKRQYYNGENTPVLYSSESDAFVLDGQRLFAVSGYYGTNGAVYGTENEGYSKIESFGGNSISGPDWFKVTTKEGLILEYGTGGSSKFYTDDTYKTMFWFLKKNY